MTDETGASNVRRPTPATISEAAEHLRGGRLVAFPTETVYGLGANACDSRAVARIYEAKGRPRFNPLIVHVADVDAARALCVFSPFALKLAGIFWPGPLTLVLRQRPDSPISPLVSAGLDTIAVRMPDHPVARQLLEASGLPVAAPSANRSGHVSATRAEHVASDLGSLVAMILDGGPTVHGLESTIVDASADEPELLRPGAITADTIFAATGRLIARGAGNAEAPSASGQLESHYAPRAKVRLNATEVRPGEALLAFGGRTPPTAGPQINLSAHGDLIEAGANLFQALRALDASGASMIAVMPIPDEGLGEAINDRLRRAASPRS